MFEWRDRDIMILQKKKKHIDEHTKDSTEHEIKLKNKPENKRTEWNWSINRTD